MTSVNTNAAALTALRNLQSTVSNLETTQNRISTGLRIGEAKDNAAYWAISTTLKSDNKSLATVKDALGLGSATVDVAYQGLTKAKDVLDEIKSKLTAATQNGVDRDVIQAEIKELQNQLKSIANSSVFSGENWLSVDSSRVDFSNTKQVVASFARAADNSVSIGTVKVDISKVSLYDSSTVAGAGGILNGAVNLKDSATGLDLTVGGKTVSTGNTSTAGLTAAAGTATGTVNTAAVTGASTVASSAATSTLTGAGAAATKGTTTQAAAWAVSAAGSTVQGDKLNLSIKIDGGAAINVVLNTAAGQNAASATGIAGITLTQIVAGINGTTGLAGVASVDATGTKLVLTSNSSNTGATASSIQLVSVAQTQADGTTALTTPATIAGLTANGSAVAGVNATAGTKTAGTAVSTTGLAVGDVVSFKYRVDGSSTPATATYTLVAGDLASANALGAKLATANFTGLTASNSSGILTFTSSTTGAASSVSIDDVTVTSSAGVIKNVNPFANADLTASKAASSTTGDVQTGYAANFAATDNISFNFTVDGGNLAPVKVAAGANLTALVANLNANTTFNAKATASVDSTTNKLVITSKTTGALSGATVNSVSFTDATGAAKNVTGSNFVNVATAATASTATFTAPITLDKDDNLTFSIQVDDATAAKTITINQALVNKALSTAAAPVTNGTINTAADLKKVIDAALTAQNITSVTTSNVSNQIVFTSKSVGTASTLNISNVAASQGGSTITVDTLDISAAGFAATGVTTDAQIKQVLQAYISVVNQAITKVTTAASNLGSVSSRIDMQKSFVNTLMDTIDKGVSNLVDADMTEESTKLQALQVKQQLGTQALSIANQSAQGLLSLFRS